MELKDNIPPQNIEAEQATLGAMLLDWSSVPDVITKLTADRFYSFQHQVIFEGIRSLANQSIHGDMLTLVNELTKLGKLEQAGGTGYIASLTDTVPTSSNVTHYVDIVLDCATRRDLIKLSSELKAHALDETKDGKSILQTAEKKIFDMNFNSGTSCLHMMSDIIRDTITLIDMRYKNNEELTGIPSGIAQLDAMTSGFQNSELIIIGARPSIGKTAFALSMMQTIAIEKNIPCGFFSLEMSYQSIGQRLLAQVARVQSNKLRNGRLNIADFQKLQDAAGKCFNSPLYIVDTPNMQLMELKSMARQMAENQGVKIIFIDYIGLITTENPNAPVYETVSEISKSLKALARELNIPIVALCQVARAAEGEEPTLAQLRGSGSIEQDADVVLFLHRDRKIMEEKNPVQEAKCIVAKQRNGATGDVEMIFFPSFTKFENKAPEN